MSQHETVLAERVSLQEEFWQLGSGKPIGRELLGPDLPNGRLV